jgi:hypothetical protein
MLQQTSSAVKCSKIEIDPRSKIDVKWFAAIGWLERGSDPQYPNSLQETVAPSAPIEWAPDLNPEQIRLGMVDEARTAFH